MKIKVKTAHGWLSALPPTPGGLARLGYAATVGEAETFDVQGLDIVPPDPQPQPPDPQPGSGDAIDFSAAVITSESPDVRSWPITTSITSYMIPSIDADQYVHSDIRFSKRGPGGWPLMEGPEGGPIQYTLWVGCKIGGVWHFSAPILCVSQSEGDNYCPTGPTLKPGQLPNNWYYYAGSPLATYQPQPGEQVAWLVTAGVQRRRDDHVVAERSNVVLAPFTSGTYSWTK